MMLRSCALRYGPLPALTIGPIHAIFPSMKTKPLADIIERVETWPKPGL